MQLPLVIDAVELSKVIDQPHVIVIDLSSEAHYETSHIPGAIRLEPTRMLCGQAPIPNKIASDAQLSELFSDAGITEASHVVVYDDQKGPWAGRFVWTMHCCNLFNVSFLNGHLDAWRLEGFPVEQTPHTPVPSSLTLSHQGTPLLADYSFIEKHVAQGDISIWDARALDEYQGTKVVNASKGGHIPTAKWLEWTDVLAHEAPALLLSPNAIKQQIVAAGLDTTKPIVTHCQTHRRSGLTYIAGLYAGIDDMRCYDGSWFEWGNLPNSAVEKSH
jgi:thiosulfate/3-mercaptopyruvate sulfurtransferase